MAKVDNMLPTAHGPGQTRVLISRSLGHKVEHDIPYEDDRPHTATNVHGRSIDRVQSTSSSAWHQRSIGLVACEDCTQQTVLGGIEAILFLCQQGFGVQELLHRRPAFLKPAPDDV